ncbi:MAG TPA: 30S ribosomal protein S16 [Candidatus Saccharimonadales bacterium]|nr:30S ribosomal protein S16 [Candidatus Saccharimonadales bacterium]
MLAIRMQRVGRTGHAQFRVIVQDSRFSPKSGRVVAYVGSYDPHTKASTIDKDKISAYLSKGAMPSDRVIGLLEKEGLKLPVWAKKSAPKQRAIKNPEKLRKNRPPEAKPAEAPQAEVTTEEVVEAPVSEAETTPTESEQTETPASEEEVQAPAAEEPETEAPAEKSAEEAAEQPTTNAESAEPTKPEEAPKDKST